VLASVGADFAIKLWDIEKGSEMISCDAVHDQLIQDLVWDYTGTTYATSCKDKHVRIIDSRTNQLAGVSAASD
jgi:coronin-1B/1C/6